MRCSICGDVLDIDFVPAHTLNGWPVCDPCQEEQREARVWNPRITEAVRMTDLDTRETW